MSYFADFLLPTRSQIKHNTFRGLFTITVKPFSTVFSFHKVIVSMRKSKMDLSSYLEFFLNSFLDEWYLVEVHGVLPTPVHAKATPHTVLSLSFSEIFFFLISKTSTATQQQSTSSLLVSRTPLLLSVLWGGGEASREGSSTWNILQSQPLHLNFKSSSLYNTKFNRRTWSLSWSITDPNLLVVHSLHSPKMALGINVCVFRFFLWLAGSLCVYCCEHWTASVPPGLQPNKHWDGGEGGRGGGGRGAGLSWAV